MKKFDTAIVDRLNVECSGEEVHFVGLGRWNFQVSFGSISQILTEEKAVFSLNSESFSWAGGPSDIPVWLVVGQVPRFFELPNPLALRMHFMSGDFVEFHTAEHQYESTTIDFGMREGIRVREVF